jgi:hypothetical protein
MLHTVSNTGIYCSSDKVGTVYLVQYIFKNSTVDINALCSLWGHGVLLVWVRLDVPLCGTVQWSGSILENVENRTYVHIYFLLRMTDTMTSQNTDLSSWDILYRQKHLTVCFTFHLELLGQHAIMWVDSILVHLEGFLVPMWILKIIFLNWWVLSSRM